MNIRPSNLREGNALERLPPVWKARDLRTRMAVGAHGRDILSQFLIEAMTLSAIGGIIGVAVGLAIALLVRNVSPLATATPLWANVVAALPLENSTCPVAPSRM